MAVGVSLNQFALLVTFVFAWWRLVRFTRISRDRAIQALENEFWINHSLDLEIDAGQTEHERDYGDMKLIIRGLEVREHGWWVDRDLYRGTEYEGWRHRLGAYWRISKRYLSKVKYYVWRNMRPFAGLDLECTFLIETENCRIASMEETEDEFGRKLHGQAVNEAIPEIDSVWTVEQNIFEPNLYRVTLSIHDPYDSVEVFSRLACSTYIKEPLHSVEDKETEE